MEEQERVARAIGRYVRIAPQKCQLVADLIRDGYVGEALTILRFTKKKKASFQVLWTRESQNLYT